MNNLPPSNEVKSELVKEYIFPTSSILEIGFSWLMLWLLIDKIISNCEKIIERVFFDQVFNPLPFLLLLALIALSPGILGIIFSKSLSYKKYTKQSDSFWNDRTTRLFRLQLAIAFCTINGFYFILKLKDLVQLIKIKSPVEISKIALENFKDGLLFSAIFLIFLGIIDLFYFSKRYLAKFGSDIKGNQ